MKWLFVFAFALLPGLAAAKDIALPDYKPAQRCKAQSKAIAGHANTPVDDQCLKTEADADKKLKKYWPRLKDKEKARCLQMANAAHLGNYKILQACLDLAEKKLDGKIKVDLPER